MKLPKNITKDHLLKAIEKIDKDGIPKDGASLYYDVVYNGKHYPPKVIVSYANIFANGKELDRNSFEGGKDTPCFKLLENNDFEIIKRQVGFYSELKRFLDLADRQTRGQGVIGAKEFNEEKLDDYLGLKVDPSLGIGRASAVPWISFLGNGQTTSNGIYPVYLYFRDRKILILAYGVSEKNTPVKTWGLKDLKLVQQYFVDNGYGLPKDYGSSYIFKVYDITKPLNEKQINFDLDAIINTYTQILDEPIIPKPKMPFNIEQFNSSARNSNLVLNDKLSLRFASSLLAKPFVILTGLSGSGKTKLAQAFAMWICESEKQYCIVPVGADWTNREPLLGFPNALKKGEYVKPENGVLDLIIEANKNEAKPYFLILDEMNLSHVERYFADFLSVMESKGAIALHEAGDWNGVPAEISLPKNLFIVGTVNIDETTYMFSPKVLDRANVIEFRVTESEMEGYLGNSGLLDLKVLKAGGKSMGESFVEIAKDATLSNNDSGELQSALLLFFKELKKTGAEFGYRTASEILRFAAVVNKLDTAWTIDEIIDAAIMQKLLPKVHGSRRKLEPVLKTLAGLCLVEGQKMEDFITAKAEFDFEDPSKIKYPISFEKLLRMYKGMLDNGFTSYAEA